MNTLVILGSGAKHLEYKNTLKLKKNKQKKQDFFRLCRNGAAYLFIPLKRLLENLVGWFKMRQMVLHETFVNL